MIRLSILPILLASSLAYGDAKSEAKKHLERAGKAHAEARYEDALRELNVAYTLDPQPAILYAIGQVHVMQGRCADAIAFYDRFLATKPDTEAASKANEAIETCKKLIKEPTAPVEPVKPPDVIKPPDPKPVPTTRTIQTPWYKDPLGDLLTGGGVVAGTIGIVMWRLALSDRDKADSSASYGTYDDLVKSAKSKQTIGIVLGASGAALVTAGVIRYLTRSSTREVAIMPTEGGAVVSWGGGF